MARRGAIDRDRRTPIKWTRGPLDLIKHVLDWASYKARFQRRGAMRTAGSNERSNEMRRSHGRRITGRSSSTCVYKRVITAEMLRRGTHLSRRIEIQGAKSKRFYNANPRGRLEPLIQIRRPRYFLKRSIVDVSS